MKLGSEKLNWSNLTRKFLVSAAACAFLGTACANRPQTSEPIRAFEERIAAYVQLHHKAATGLTERSSTTPAQTTEAADVLAERIRAARPNAKSGDVFAPVAASLRRTLRSELRGVEGANVLGSINDSNLRDVELGVNQMYPAELPRTTVPASVLSKLPPLPKELEYRFMGRSLLLIDVRANLVVDTLADVLPPPS